MEEKKDKYGKYLPIGSIVKLKSATKKLMVTGFCMYDNDGERTLYDYCGCPFQTVDNEEVSITQSEIQTIESTN